MSLVTTFAFVVSAYLLIRFKLFKKIQLYHLYYNIRSLNGNENKSIIVKQKYTTLC